MARKRSLTDEQLIKARAKLARGYTMTDVAKGMGVTAPGLKLALAREKIPPAPPVSYSVAAAADAELSALVADAGEDGEIMASDELRRRMSALARRLELQAVAAERDGNMAEARKLNDSLVKTMSAYARVTNRDDPSLITISKEELAAKANALREMLLTRAGSATRLHCQSCGIELMQNWAREAK